MALISLDYDSAMRQVTKLKNAAAQCEEAKNAVNKVIELATENWSGEAQTGFLNKMSQWKAENDKLYADILDVAELIKMTAREIRDADATAASIVKG